MTEAELARALVGRGLLTPDGARTAASQRAPGRSFAQVLVEMNLVSANDILQVDPTALPAAGNSSATSSTNGAAPSEVAVAEPTSSSGVGLGTERDTSEVAELEIVGDEGAKDASVAPIVRYANELLRIAVALGASDLHLEPTPGGLQPRYRVDGQLRPGELIPAELGPFITSRLKVLGNLDITESRLPQDGRFRATTGKKVYDFRVSTLPSMHGEKVVMRLLDHSSLVTDLRRLGFSPTIGNRFEELVRRPHGLVLVTGPTGSGKTTTLYAALAATSDPTKNVVTVEDPVEYEFPGVTQTSVQSDIGLTFAAALRSILRQDPDVILVGEVRDGETADMAVRAALTGHLVLATLHTNSAVGAVARLRDMGSAPYLLASSLTGVIAQRLVRILCRHCRYQLEGEALEAAQLQLDLPADTVLWGASGCEACGGTGYRGRAAVTELLEVNRELRVAITNNAGSDEIRELAVKSGMQSLWEDAQEKLQIGLTSADEVARALLGTED